jgi:hypothetical protein
VAVKLQNLAVTEKRPENIIVIIYWRNLIIDCVYLVFCRAKNLYFSEFFYPKTDFTPCMTGGRIFFKVLATLVGKLQTGQGHFFTEIRKEKL